MAKNLSTFAIAQLLHVDPGSVANWIDRGLLRAYRTPGGHRRVTVENLVRFLEAHDMPVPKGLDIEPKRVLVVESDPSVSHAVKETIQSRHPDCQVTEAHDGFHAGILAITLQPKAIILDMQMPGLNGGEVCRLIHSHLEGNNTFIVATADEATEAEIRKIKKAGAQVFLPKPLDMKRIQKEIEAFL